MAPVKHPRGRATFADIAQLSDDRRVEIIDGAIVDKAAPTMEHASAQTFIAGSLARLFVRKPGGRWPGGWWIGTEVDVEYRAHDIFRHDLVGWRRDRVPERPSGRPIRVRPDWACEIQSPSNRRRDTVDKLKVLQDAGVPHYWLVDPEEKTLIVHRLEPGGYQVVLAAGAGETVRAEPFEAVELEVDVLLGDKDLPE